MKSIVIIFILCIFYSSCKKNENETQETIFTGEVYDLMYNPRKLTLNIDSFKIVCIKDNKLMGINITDSIRPINFLCNDTSIIVNQTVQNILNIDTTYIMVCGTFELVVVGKNMKITKTGSRIDTSSTVIAKNVDNFNTFIFNRHTGKVLKCSDKTEISFDKHIYQGTLSNQVPSDDHGNYYLLKDKSIYQLIIDELSGTYSVKTKFEARLGVLSYRIDKDGNALLCYGNSFDFIDINNVSVNLDNLSLGYYFWKGTGGKIFASTNNGKIYKFNSKDNISIINDFNASWSFLTDIDLYNYNYLIYNDKTNSVIFAGMNQVAELDQNNYKFKINTYYFCNCSTSPDNFLVSKNYYFSRKYDGKFYGYPVTLSDYPATNPPNVIHDFTSDFSGSFNSPDATVDYLNDIAYLVIGRNQKYYLAEINKNKQFKLLPLNGEISNICKL